MNSHWSVPPGSRIWVSLRASVRGRVPGIADVPQLDLGDARADRDVALLEDLHVVARLGARDPVVGVDHGRVAQRLILDARVAGSVDVVRDADDRDLLERALAARRPGEARRGLLAEQRIGLDVEQHPLVAPVGHQRMGVRAALGRDAVDQPRCRRPRDVEDPDALEAARSDRGRVAALRGLPGVDRLEQQAPLAGVPHRHVVLRALAGEVGHDPGRLALEVEDAEAAEVPLVGEVAVEREIGVDPSVAVVGVPRERQVAQAGVRARLCRAGLDQAERPVLEHRSRERGAALGRPVSAGRRR